MWRSRKVQGRAVVVEALVHVRAVLQVVLEQVDLAVLVSEARADVGGCLDIDHPGAGTERAKDSESVAVVGHDLGVDAGPAGTQRADELGDEPLSLESSYAADDGESGVELVQLGRCRVGESEVGSGWVGRSK